MGTVLTWIGWIVFGYFVTGVVVVLIKNWRALAELFFFTWGAPIANWAFRYRYKVHIKQLDAVMASNREHWKKLEPKEMAFAMLGENLEKEAKRMNSILLLTQAMEHSLTAGKRLDLHKEVRNIK